MNEDILGLWQNTKGDADLFQITHTDNLFCRVFSRF